MPRLFPFLSGSLSRGRTSSRQGTSVGKGFSFGLAGGWCALSSYLGTRCCVLHRLSGSVKWVGLSLGVVSVFCYGSLRVQTVSFYWLWCLFAYEWVFLLLCQGVFFR